MAEDTPTSIAARLRECPFCNEQDDVQCLHQGAAEEWWFQVYCDGCCASGPSCESAEKAIEAWNTRPLASPPDGEEGR